MNPLPTVTADVTLNVAGRRLEARLEAPAGPTPLRELLPIARGLVGASVAAAAEDAAGQGLSVSCKAGCGACCRQLVPLSRPEAHLVGDLLEQLPEPRRAEVRARFAAARERLAAAGLLARLESGEPFGDEEIGPVGRAYFQLGIACPFLEEESCSVYDERPLVCREYLVVSPPEHCARPGGAGVMGLVLPLNVRSAFFQAASHRADRRPEWVPLVLAPAWAEAHPEGPPARTGPEHLRTLFAELTGRDLPPPPP
jgi:Fe-S-cluster containining protein